MRLGMIDYLIHGQFSDFILTALAIVLAIALHEFGHAAADELQGDPTARLAGRLTLNPVRHLDPFGTLMIVLVGFGWGKPVPMTPSKLRNRRFGAALVGAAGPLVNVILAFIAAALLVRLGLVRQGVLMSYNLASRFLLTFLYLNVLLAILNLLPIPPLDGSRILGAILPPSKQHIIFFLDQYGFVILLIAALLVLPRILGPIATSARDLVLRLMGG
jgi:Zn-dependent protease